jgi:predicted transcriptional regulator of viral defense system
MVDLGKQDSRLVSLTEYLKRLQFHGRNYFFISEIEEALGMKRSSISSSLSRLAKKGLLKMVKRGFGVLLTPDGVEPHPSSYVGPMMKHLGANYYVGLLSAASHWGASHQASMSYIVFSDKIIKDIVFERGRVEFITRKDMKHEGWIQNASTLMGYFKVSSPELTAIDLIRFPKKSGHLSNVATVLEELVEKWDGRTMASLCMDRSVPTISLQRLGYILDVVLGFNKESSYMQKALGNRTPVATTLSKLVSGKKMSDYEYNGKWMLYVNTEVEPD